MLVRIIVVLMLSLFVGHVSGIVAHETYHAIKRPVPVTQACYFGWWKMPGVLLFGWVNGQDVTAASSTEEDTAMWIYLLTFVPVASLLGLFLATGYLPRTDWNKSREEIKHEKYGKWIE
jgi:uncharacterized membrane protein